MINKLVIEGNAEIAKSLIDNEMRRAGIKPNKHTQLELLSGDVQTEAKLERARRSVLRMALHSFTPSGLEEAEALFSLMRQHGVAKSCHFELMLKHGCELSDVLRDAIATGELRPREKTYNVLVHRLLLEGDRVGARGVMENDMRVAGFQPSEEVLRAMEMVEAEDGGEVGRWRNMEVRRMILLGKVDASKAFLKRLKRNGIVVDQSDKAYDHPFEEQDKAFSYLNPL